MKILGRGSATGEAGRRRRRVEPTDDWAQLELLCRWPEQLAYEQVRPLVLFGLPVPERAEQTGAAERTLYRRVARFEAEGVESLPADPDRTFFAERFARVLDALGYAVWRRWRVYGEEGPAGREAALWLREKTLTVEHAGEAVSRYTVEFPAGTEKPQAVGRPVPFGTSLALAQPRLFGLDPSGTTGG